MDEIRMYRCDDCHRTVPVSRGDSTKCPYCGQYMTPCY